VSGLILAICGFRYGQAVAVGFPKVRLGPYTQFSLGSAKKSIRIPGSRGDRVFRAFRS